MLAAALGYVLTAAAIVAKVAVVAGLAVCTISLIAALKRRSRE